MNLQRRDFLKYGAALPLAMHSLGMRAEAAKKSKSPPRRIMFICNSLGFYEPYFFPKNRGDLASSSYLRKMATKDKMTVFQNLFHPGMETSNHDSEKSFLTGVPNPESQNFVNSVSVDQVLAEHMGGETRFPFLPMSIYDRGWGCSWNRRGVAIPPLHDETQIFDKLFGDEDLTEKRRQLEQDQLIVRSLYRDMAQLRKQPGGASGVESYRSVVAELESQLEHEQFWMAARKPVPPFQLSDDREYAFSAKVKNLFELSRLAFQTDSTRIITLSLDWIYGAIRVPGATGGWHTLSHHGGKPELLASLSRVERDILKHLNEFLTNLDQIKEGNGTLLDHTTVVVGSNFGDASNHTCNNLPTLVVGGGYRHQNHVVLEKPTPLCNLWLELLHRHNLDAGEFGSGSEDARLLGA